MKIGVIAVQGSFQEHSAVLRRLGAHPVEVKTVQDLAGVQGLVLPGGESTTMGLLYEANGLIAPLRKLISEDTVPVLATCAGLILLADRVTSQRVGGQALLGGLHVEVDRNGFGRQVDSCETDLVSDIVGPIFSRGVFIRAPRIVSVDADVEVIARMAAETVAVRQGNIVALCFHPELTEDPCWHAFFLKMVEVKAEQ